MLNSQSIVDKVHDQNYLRKIIQSKQQDLQQELSRLRDYRRSLEEEKTFWKQREENFRRECYKLKQLDNKENQHSTDPNYRARH